MHIKTAVLLGFALLGCAVAPATAKSTAPAATTSAHHAQSARKKAVSAKAAKTHRRSSSRYRAAAGFIPPPPAYMPSILPEIAARRAQGLPDTGEEALAEDDAPQNPYKKYIYERQGTTPSALQERKGVVTWARRN